MGQIYNLTRSGSHDASNKQYSFIQNQQNQVEESSTYMGVLRVFRSAFSTIDFPDIVRNSIQKC